MLQSCFGSGALRFFLLCGEVGHSSTGFHTLLSLCFPFCLTMIASHAALAGAPIEMGSTRGTANAVRQTARGPGSCA